MCKHTTASASQSLCIVSNNSPSASSRVNTVLVHVTCHQNKTAINPVAVGCHPLNYHACPKMGRFTIFFIYHVALINYSYCI